MDPSVHCAACGETVPSRPFCASCGATLLSAPCEACGRPSDPSVGFCPSCQVEAKRAAERHTRAAWLRPSSGSASKGPRSTPAAALVHWPGAGAVTAVAASAIEDAIPSQELDPPAALSVDGRVRSALSAIVTLCVLLFIFLALTIVAAYAAVRLPTQADFSRAFVAAAYCGFWIVGGWWMRRRAGWQWAIAFWLLCLLALPMYVYRSARSGRASFPTDWSVRLVSALTIVLFLGALSGEALPGVEHKVSAESQRAGDGTGTDASQSPLIPPAGVPATAQRATVSEVIDATTVRVLFADGTEETIRLAGVEAPDGRALSACTGQEATAYLRKLLPAGREVWLELEGQDRDSAGRLVRFVWVAKQAGGQYLLNAVLVRDGVVTVASSASDSRWLERFEEAARTARERESCPAE